MITCEDLRCAIICNLLNTDQCHIWALANKLAMDASKQALLKEAEELVK